MLVDFFLEVRKARVPASLREYLDLVEALQARLAFADLDEFYYLSRLCLVKDERHFDKFDRAFDSYFKGIESLDMALEAAIPDDWLRAEFERQLSEEDKRKIASLGGLEELIETFKQRLEEQKRRHQGGNKMIGTGGTSPFGANGYNPEGFRIGQKKSRHKSALKIWEKRGYRDLDDSITIGIRNIWISTWFLNATMR